MLSSYPPFPSVLITQLPGGNPDWRGKRLSRTDQRDKNRRSNIIMALTPDTAVYFRVSLRADEFLISEVSGVESRISISI